MRFRQRFDGGLAQQGSGVQEATARDCAVERCTSKAGSCADRNPEGVTGGNPLNGEPHCGEAMGGGAEDFAARGNRKGPKDTQ